MKVLWLVVPLFLLIGCSSPDKLVGNWEGSPTIVGRKASQFVQLREDGKYESRLMIEGSQGALVATDKGTWKRLDAQTVKIQLTSVSWDLVGTDEATRKNVVGQYKSMESKMLEEANKFGVSKLTWKNNNEVTFETNGESVTFIRK